MSRGRFMVGLDPSLDSAKDTPRVFDEYFKDDTPEELIAKVVNNMLAGMPEDQVAVLELLMCGVIVPSDDSDPGTAQGYREAGRILRVDHKTVKRRLDRALAVAETRLGEVPDWVLVLLGDQLPIERDIEVAPIDIFGPMRDAIARLRGAA